MRLIDADELKKVIFSKTDSMEDLWDTAGVLNAINNAPTVSDRSLEIAQKSIELGRKVRQLERKHKWIKNKVAFYQGCPECGAYIRSNASEIYLNQREINFCPYCGEDMRKRGEKEC